MAFDFKKEYKEFYMPKNKPEIVNVPKANYIAVRGKGNPNEEGGAYQQAISYCNNAKLTIESFSYLGQLNNYITMLIQPVRKFFRAGHSCFYSFFSL